MDKFVVLINVVAFIYIYIYIYIYLPAIANLRYPPNDRHALFFKLHTSENV